ncbi:selenocysteine lyase [Bufo gargarizans]|uniref:selenocysteine lyase n=1 Tax=Bufo gargarizans TaxID=30331 RepID=UPI001CF31AF8|nr:selenocysteine lyase [Bufo gargarizans]XP_044144463.1 selenocysteine lyase [Bufo gargarizans]XP_044144464.1 selenocysteine lyase [Bufo gargarizans]
MAEKIETSAKSKVYLDYNATTPPAAEVVDVITEALQEAWGNPSSSYSAGSKAKELIDTARAQIARMVRGKPEDVIFTSGGTEANNMVLFSAVDYFNMSIKKEQSSPLDMALPHIITSNVEHDSIVLPLKHLQRAHRAEVTFVPVSTRTGCVEVDDVVAALRPNTCLVSIMLANNETGVIMPISKLSHRLVPISKERKAQGLPSVLLHTDAAQALGKVSVDVQELGVHYLTIVGHKFYGPRIGALYVHGIEHKTPLLPMLHGGGQERNYRPGTENTPMIAGLGKAAELVSLHCPAYENHMRNVRDYMEERLQTAFDNMIRFNSHFSRTERLPNTCNVSLLRPAVLGREWLSHCDYLLASVGAACHSDRGDRPSHVLLSSGVPPEAARGAIRLSVGRDTSIEDVDLIVEDLKQAAQRLENKGTEEGELKN